MPRNRFRLLIALLALFTVALLPSCDSRNIFDVIRQMAEIPVDTTGYARRELRTNNFSSIRVDCFADVTLHQTAPDEVPHIVLQAPDEVLDNVAVKVSEETLVLSLFHRYKMPDNVALVTHIYAPFVSYIELHGCKCLRMGKISVACPLEIYANGLGSVMADSIEAHDLSVNSNGAGSIGFRHIKTNSIRFECNGSGSIVLAGQCRRGQIDVNGVGQLDLTGLHCDPSTLQVTANGVGAVAK